MTGCVGVGGLCVPIGQKNTPLLTTAGGLLAAASPAGKITSSPALVGMRPPDQLFGLLQRAEFPLFIGIAPPVQAVPAAAQAPAAPVRHATATFMITVPVEPGLKVAHVSPATRSVSIAVNGGTPVIANVTPGQSTPVQVDAQEGSNTFTVKLFDGSNPGMGGRKVTDVAELPADKVLLDYIREAVSLNEDGVKAPKAKKAPKKELEIPDYFLAALKKNKKAQATFEAFSPSHKREYVEWITEAKQEATRDRRLAQAIKWMAAGKPRNWKYMNC